MGKILDLHSSTIGIGGGYTNMKLRWTVRCLAYKIDPMRIEISRSRFAAALIVIGLVGVLPSVTTPEPIPNDGEVTADDITETVRIHEEGPDCYGGNCFLPWSTRHDSRQSGGSRVAELGERLLCNYFYSTDEDDFTIAPPVDPPIVTDQFDDCVLDRYRIVNHRTDTVLAQADGFEYLLVTLNGEISRDDRRQGIYTNQGISLFDPERDADWRKNPQLTNWNDAFIHLRATSDEVEFLEFSPHESSVSCSGGFDLVAIVASGVALRTTGAKPETAKLVNNGVAFARNFLPETRIGAECDALTITRPTPSGDPENDGLIWNGKLVVRFSSEKTLFPDGGKDTNRTLAAVGVFKYPIGTTNPVGSAEGLEPGVQETEQAILNTIRERSLLYDCSDTKYVIPGTLGAAPTDNTWQMTVAEVRELCVLDEGFDLYERLEEKGWDTDRL